MSILEIDTDILRQSVTVAESANQQITDAMNMLNKISVHDDWNCPYRETLKERTLNNRAKISEIQSNSSNFYQAVKTSSERFDQAERDCISRQSIIESALETIHNIVPISSGGAPINTGPKIPNISYFANLADSMLNGGKK